MQQERYTNGQIVQEMKGDVLYYYYKNGQVRAYGQWENGQMQGEWVFYRQSGQLWQVGHFLNHEKHGRWVRYGLDDAVEYDETFEHGKQVKKGKKG